VVNRPGRRALPGGRRALGMAVGAGACALLAAVVAPSAGASGHAPAGAAAERAIAAPVVAPSAPTDVELRFFPGMKGLWFYVVDFTPPPDADPAGHYVVAVAETATSYEVAGPGGRLEAPLEVGRVATVTVTAVDGQGNAGPPSAPVRFRNASPRGYWLLEASGAVHAFGGVGLHGDARAQVTASGAPAVDIARLPGLAVAEHLVLLADGQVVSPGSDLGSTVATGLLAPGERAVGVAAAPGGGHWVTTDRGRVLGFRGAPGFGDLSGTRLNAPVLDIVATRSGAGYYLLAADGGVFAFGDAVFHGSTGAQRLNQPVVAMATDPDGAGYWLAASDGGVFAFDATFHGSMAAQRLNQPVRGITSLVNAYLLTAADGGVFALDATGYAGGLGSTPPPTPVVAAASGSST
jgi:hypothetical protein